MQTPLLESSTSGLNIQPNPAFGENLKEFEGKSKAKENLPTKSTLAKDLSPAKIKGHIEQWDLQSPNPKNLATSPRLLKCVSVVL
ncbi:hypothetical protein [Helicobacter felis]|uniref:hypothetical protein n=1 Tax=Helicobacter felis TaxID=214 RepID=UPI000CEE39CF|nr:hypothetical protein [Helicobacter felis]